MDGLLLRREQDMLREMRGIGASMERVRCPDGRRSILAQAGIRQLR